MTDCTDIKNLDVFAFLPVVGLKSENPFTLGEPHARVWVRKGPDKWQWTLSLGYPGYGIEWDVDQSQSHIFNDAQALSSLTSYRTDERWTEVEDADRLSYFASIISNSTARHDLTRQTFEAGCLST